MKQTLKRTLAFLLLLLILPAGALALTGQNISTFLTYYQENVSFINSNEGRHMLPIELEPVKFGNTGQTQYAMVSDALHITVMTDDAGIIESCEIRLLLPEGAAHGNSLYLDYVSANYHSLAFIMAMHGSSTPESRFYLVEEIRTALIDNHGAYERQLGAYTISCVSVAGEGAVFTFTNNGIAPAETELPDGQTPAPVEDDAEAGLG